MVVSDTGPLIALATVDQLTLLDEIRREGYWLSDELIDVATRLAGEA